MDQLCTRIDALAPLSPTLPHQLRDGAQLDLEGHTLGLGTSPVRVGVAVLFEGQGAVLQNGTVRCDNCDDLIRVAGRGKHTVRHIDTSRSGQANGITVVSDSNRLLSNIGVGYNIGFLIGGNKNQLDSNQALGQAGFFVDGHQNQLVNNSASNAHDGFRINGNKNVLMDNDASSNGVGIYVLGEGNGIKRNTALGNNPDLWDEHEDCDKNRWQKNIFETSRAGATANPPCIQ